MNETLTEGVPVEIQAWFERARGHVAAGVAAAAKPIPAGTAQSASTAPSNASSVTSGPSTSHSVASAPAGNGKKSSTSSCGDILAPPRAKKGRVQDAADIASLGSMSPLKPMTQLLAPAPQPVQAPCSSRPAASESSRVRDNTRSHQRVETTVIRARYGP